MRDRTITDAVMTARYTSPYPEASVLVDGPKISTVYYKDGKIVSAPMSMVAGQARKLAWMLLDAADQAERL